MFTFVSFGNFGPLPFGQLCGGTEQLEEKDGIASRETRKGNIVYCLGKQTRIISDKVLYRLDFVGNMTVGEIEIQSAHSGIP